MGLRLYNTASRSVQPFSPQDPGRVGIYACGPTLYGPAHIGNFRTFLFYDLVHRYLEWRGYGVHFVMNFTDVDDKTIAAARARGATLADYTPGYERQVVEEADLLGVRRFDAYPKATAYIGPMVALVERLLERGLAYVTPDGSVFFRIAAFPDYGALSGRDPGGARTGERVAGDDYGKEDGRDFALWKGVKEGDREAGAAWSAPWGEGRPGWHLECSAMALSEVGGTVDLHLGGEDLIFPHHEDEIAQSEGATGKPFVRHWLHAKHLRVEGRKMSKSLGNVVGVGTLLAEGVSAAALRHLLISAHYRTELNFTGEGLKASRRSVDRLLDFDSRLRSHPVRSSGPGSGVGDASESALANFREALDDDLNVARGIGVLFEFVNRVNGQLDTHAAIGVAERDEACAALASIDEVLGLIEVGRRGREVDKELGEWIEERIEARRRARAAREWVRADAIRDELAAEGVVLEDGPAGTRWKMRQGRH